MGLEAKCIANIQGIAYSGTLHFDSKEIAFSCRQIKWRQAVGPSVTAKTVGGSLVIGKGKNEAIFEIGDEAIRWLDKVLNPPSRTKKLGVKQGQKIVLSGSFAVEIQLELREAGATLTKSIEQCALLLCLVERTEELPRLRNAMEKLSSGKSLWAVWPKGVRSITQKEIMDLAAEFGMGPGKACSFDDRLTAMRFTQK